MKPLVSVVTITYNHEPWIAKCIEGVLIQKTDFPIEMVIAEDCSTDGTRKICERYAIKYPDIIRLLPSEKNWGIIQNEKRGLNAAKGKYIALCEGDDYWTDPLKIQKQASFLENNPDYGACFTRCFHSNPALGFFQKDNGDEYFEKYPGLGTDVSTEMFFNDTVSLMYLTLMFKTRLISDSIINQYQYWRDTHLFYHLLISGKVFLFSFFGGVRTIHEDSMTHIDIDYEIEESVLIHKELNKYYHYDKQVRHAYKAALFAAYAYFKKINKAKSQSYSFDIFLLDKKIHRYVLRLLNFQ